MTTTAADIKAATLAYHPRGKGPDPDFVALIDSQDGVKLADAIADVVDDILANADTSTEDGAAAADRGLMALTLAVPAACKAARDAIHYAGDPLAASIAHCKDNALAMLPTDGYESACAADFATVPILYLIRAARDCAVNTASDPSSKLDHYDVWASMCHAGVTVARAGFTPPV